MEDPARVGPGDRYALELSNLGHALIGVMVAIGCLLAALTEVEVLSQTWWYAWPSAFVGVGVFLPLYLVWWAGRLQIPVREFLADPMQKQHLIIGLVVILGSAAELIHIGADIGWLGFGFPIALGVIGYLFIVHEQHGDPEAGRWSTRAHRLLGSTLIAAGLARALQVGGVEWGALRFAWIVILYSAASFLFYYREPPGATVLHGSTSDEGAHGTMHGGHS